MKILAQFNSNEKKSPHQKYLVFQQLTFYEFNLFFSVNCAFFTLGEMLVMKFFSNSPFLSSFISSKKLSERLFPVGPFLVI